MQFNFQNFFFSRLPNFFKINDTYKDNNDRGLLERYLEIFGMELNDNINPSIENYLDNIDPLTTDPKFLTTLGYTLGSPPQLLNDPSKYAQILAYIIQIYKIKGTKKSYELLFALLGYTITVIEIPPAISYNFDESHLLDDGPIFDNGCPPCSEYEIVVLALLTPPTGTCPAPTFASINNTILPTFISIIELNEPINAHLKGLISGGRLCEEVSYCVKNDIQLTVYRYNALDSGYSMDDGIIYDTNDNVQDESIGFDCTNNSPRGVNYDIIGTTLIVY